MLVSMPGTLSNSGKAVLAQKLLNVQTTELIKNIPMGMLRDGSWAILIPLVSSGLRGSRKNSSDGRT